ncbi:MAG: hypothetical protein JNK27_16985 [Chitinophagaceae bacterium]|nr:hypothetical protein [Chitinophagaceae bacterium]
MKEQTELAGKPKDNLRAMRILTAALSIGVVFFTLVVVFVNQLTKTPPLANSELLADNNTSLGIVAIIGSACIAGARLLYKKRITAIKQSGKSLNDKLGQYRTALILYLAICEAAAMFSVIFFFLTGNFVILAVTGLMLIMMLSKIPVPGRLIRELDLDWKEQQELE